MDIYNCPCGSKIKLFAGKKVGAKGPQKIHFQTTKHQLWEYRQQNIRKIREFLMKILPPENIK